MVAMLDKLYVSGERIFHVCKNHLQRRPKGDEKQVACREPTNIRQHRSNFTRQSNPAPFVTAP